MTSTRGGQTTRVLRGIERESGRGTVIGDLTVGHSYRCEGAAREILCTLDEVRGGTTADRGRSASRSSADQAGITRTEVWT